MQSHLVISQPMLMPWRGMFEQIMLCDKFVFYDDVQLPLGGGRGRGFITRVQIKTPRRTDWLSLPIARAGKGKQFIRDARFVHMNWKQEHLGKIAQAYRPAPHFEAVYESVVRPIYSLESESVAEFCMRSMLSLLETFGLAPQVFVSSELGVSSGLDASERVLAICKLLNACDYISGLGAMNYIDYSMFERSGVRIHYMNYQNEPYPQLYGEFTPYVSILDLLFNVGAEARLHLNPRCIYWKDWPHMQEGRPVGQRD